MDENRNLLSEARSESIHQHCFETKQHRRKIYILIFTC